MIVLFDPWGICGRTENFDYGVVTFNGYSGTATYDNQNLCSTSNKMSAFGLKRHYFIFYISTLT